MTARPRLPLLLRLSTLLSALALGITAQAADVRVYVQFAPGQKATVQAALNQARARTHHAFDSLNAVAVTLPEQARDALLRNPAVVQIEEDPVRGFLSQTTPYGISAVQATDPAFATAPGAGGTGVTVGVVDSGVYLGHEDLTSARISGYPKFAGNDPRNWDTDLNSHGTHVVGTIAAAQNSLGVVGVAPEVSIYMVKVFGENGDWIYSSDLLAAATKAVDAGAKIVSMSLGGGLKSRFEETGLANLYNQRGALLVAAAGNDGTTKLSYPASYASVISVAAVDQAGTVASFSQKNSAVELAAPGVGVLSTVSYQDATSVTTSAATYRAGHIEFSGRGTVSGVLVDGGLAPATNSAWAGKVVLVQRGTNSFLEKVSNVQASGGLACIIYNNVDGEFSGTLGTGNSSTIPAVSVSQANGTLLLGAVGTTVTVSSSFQQPASGYDYFDGTSMATPHVAGVAALLWSKYPSKTNVQIRQAMTSTALDRGAAGRDTSYGYGIVQAKAALDFLAAPTGGDTTAPVITGFSATSPKTGSLVLAWTTDEPATSKVKLTSGANTTTHTGTTFTQTHQWNFRVTKGATYTYEVTSTDAAGNASLPVIGSITVK